MKLSLVFLSSLCVSLVYADTIPEVDIGADPQFTTLIAALEAAGLLETLSGDGPFTVFAPTNDAFDAIGYVLNQLLLPCNSAALTDILKYHVVSGEFGSVDLVDGQTPVTLEDSTLIVKIDENDVIKINDSKVTTRDIPASNGVIHEIDAVLIPSTVDVSALFTKCDHIPGVAIAANPEFTTLVAALSTAGLLRTLSGYRPFTVFAPTNDAFDAIGDVVNQLLLPCNSAALTDILKYHVVSGTFESGDLVDGENPVTLEGTSVIVTIDVNDVIINESKVTTRDISASNGVIHEIDAVLIPSTFDVSALFATCPNIPEVAIAADPEFATLVTALSTVGLLETLSGDGPFTVFAPTNDAFDAIGDVVNQLLLPCNSANLKDILKYHVVNGTFESGDLVDDQTLKTLEDSNTTVKIDRSGGVMINESKVTTPDISASNGVIHEIDAVLIPSTVDVFATCDSIPEVAIAANPQFTTLVAALSTAGLLETLSGDGPFTVFAPTNAAFFDLGGVVNQLLLPCNSVSLTDILKYHVVNGTFESGDLVDDQTVKTLQDSNTTVKIDTGGVVMINDSKVTTPDIPAINGVIHEIDAVLIPSTFDGLALLTVCPTESPSSAPTSVPTVKSAASMPSGFMSMTLAFFASMFI